MMGKIEAGLREKFDRFGAAARQEDLNYFATLGQDKSGQPLALDREQLGFLSRAAGATYSGTEAVSFFLSLAATYVPDTLWNTVVMAAGQGYDLGQLRRNLVDLGIRLTADPAVSGYLAHLNMVGALMPPLPGLLEWLQNVAGIAFLGDGDRRLEVGPPPELRRTPPIGPLGVLRGLMMAGEFNHRLDAGALEGLARVAVIDSGIDAEHPGLAGRVEKQFALGGSTPLPDPVGHGTHVAGIIAGLPLTEVDGLCGVAPFCRLIDISLYNPLGATTLHMLAGFGCAIEQGVDIINLSMGAVGAPTNARTLEVMAVEQAVSRGIVVCVSAGNGGRDGSGTITVPADAPSGIAVAACSSAGLWAEFSSQGPTDDPAVTGDKPTVAAPGVNIVSLRSRFCVTQPYDEQGHYLVMDGTSMAAPMISGMCAIGVAWLRSQGLPIPSPLAFRDALQESGRVFHADEHQHLVGAGVPQLPLFLRGLKARAERSSADKSETVRSEAPASASAAEQIVSPTEEAVAMVEKISEREREREKAKMSALAAEARGLRSLESAFLEGVKANLDRYANELAKELTGVDHAFPENNVENNEALRFDGLASAEGIDPGVTDKFPLNLEYNLDICRKKGKPLFRVIVKSFAAWQAMSLATCGSCSLEAGRVAEFMEKKRREAIKLPCVFVLFSPGGWPEEIKGVALSGRDREVILCQQADGVTCSMWFDVVSPDISWYSWLALTPMPYEKRVAECLARVQSFSALKVPLGTLSFGEIIPVLGLPGGVAAKMLPEALGRDARFRVIPENGEEQFVERVKMV
jgi:subtilisin family serine protease